MRMRSYFCLPWRALHSSLRADASCHCQGQSEMPTVSSTIAEPDQPTYVFAGDRHGTHETRLRRLDDALTLPAHLAPVAAVEQLPRQRSHPILVPYWYEHTNRGATAR